MTVRSVITVLLGLALLPWPAAAQSAAPSDTLRLEVKRRATVVRPEIKPETAARDTEEAIAELRRQGREDVVREVTGPPRRQPAFDYDVRSGIQSRNLNNALRR